jgi:hypothetical protein
MQTARTQFHVFETFAIGVERAVIVNSARHVRPMTLHDFAVGGLLEIENIECTGRAGDYVGSFLRALCEAVSLKERGHSAKRRDVGAGG